MEDIQGIIKQYCAGAEDEAIVAALKGVPTKPLLKAARIRNEEVRAKDGPYAAQKKMAKCPKCKERVSARAMRLPCPHLKK